PATGGTRKQVKSPKDRRPADSRAAAGGRIRQGYRSSGEHGVRCATMPILYHLWLSPFCRKVRLALRERNIDFELKLEEVWRRSDEFLLMNPAGTVPVLVEDDGKVLADSNAICEYIDEVYPAPSLIGNTPIERAETRRLVAWFDDKFNR